MAPHDDPKLERWQRGEQRRSLFMAVLVAILLLQSLALGFLVFQTPTVDRIDHLTEDINEQEKRQECGDVLEARFLSLIGEVILLPREDRDAALRDLEVANAALDRIAQGEDPCVLTKELFG